jgi:hypothetical protein
MSGLRLDISGLGQICSVKLDLALWKSRSGAKTMNLGPDKLTVHKLNTIEVREIKGTTRSNPNTRNDTYS